MASVQTAKNDDSKQPLSSETQNVGINTKLSEWIWYKHNKNGSWMRLFAVFNDIIITLYNGRNAFKSGNEPIHTIKLLTTTEIVSGNDIICLQSLLAKKGQVKWNNRWCVLCRDGFVQYIKNKELRSIDFSTAQLKLQNNKIIEWNDKNGELVQFHFNSQSMQKQWHSKMIEIQNTYSKFRSQNKSKLQTLFSFTLIQRSQLKNESNHNESIICVDEHYFSVNDQKQLKLWETCIHKLIVPINTQKTVVKHKRVSSIINSKQKRKVDKIVKKLEDEIEIEHINKVYFWFFGGLEKKEKSVMTGLVIQCILASKKDLFYKLFQSIKHLDFDTRKQMTQIIAEIVKCFDKNQCYQFIINRTNEIGGYNPIIQRIFDKYDVNTNEILIEMIKQSELTDFLLNVVKIGGLNKTIHYCLLNVLLTFMEDSDLVLSSSAYETLHCLFTRNNKQSQICISKYLDRNFEGIFERIDKMIKYENFILQKKGLQLLFDIFSFDINYPIMIKYINNKQNFMTCMNLIERYHNKSISFAAWNIFKLFIYNKIQKDVKLIICNKKEYIKNLLMTLDAKKATDGNFSDERTMVVNKLLNLSIT